MNVMELIQTRQSCRSYLDKPVSREDLIQIVDAGRLSPSACNAQPWKFLIIDEPDAKAKLCDALVVEGGVTGCAWREKAPAFIAVVELPANVMPAVKEYYHDSQRFAQGDLGMAVMNMCYEAVQLGLSTCILGLNDQKKMEQYFGIPEGRTVRMILAVGYSAENAEPRAKVRKPLEEVCSFNHW